MANQTYVSEDELPQQKMIHAQALVLEWQRANLWLQACENAALEAQTKLREIEMRMEKADVL